MLERARTEMHEAAMEPVLTGSAKSDGNRTDR